jgi:hypothetical protein
MHFYRSWFEMSSNPFDLKKSPKALLQMRRIGLLDFAVAMAVARASCNASPTARQLRPSRTLAKISGGSK